MSCRLSLIVITHDSNMVIGRCVEAIDSQSITPDQVIVVDSGSADPSYLDEYRQRENYQIHLQENIGFAAANNWGLRFIGEDSRYILFINPDTFLEPDTIKCAVAAMEKNRSAAIVSGRLKGYDVNRASPTGLLDSTGVFRTWYGRWYDRGQGRPDRDNFRQRQVVPALCGAFMLCRTEALEPERPEVFDESFFMYKEDIDLCLRLRKNGWSLQYDPTVELFHGRGWSQNRKQIAYRTRCMASRNEIILNLKHRSPYLLWSVGKYLLVRLLHV